MKTARQCVQGLARYVLVVIALSMIPGAVHAQDNFDKFIGFYAELEGYAKDAGVSLPFSSQQATDAKTFVQCLDAAGDNDVQIAICIDQFKDTPTGSGISKQSEIPHWVWNLLDSYICYRTGDWWGLGYSLGEAAVCLVLQVATGGTPICDILEELVELANAVWDAAKAVAQFFASVGEAAYDTVKDVGCALGLGGCDDGPSTPPEVIVYNSVFATRLGEGLAARKAWDNGGLANPSFDNLVTMLKNNALHKPEPIVSDPQLMDIYRAMGVISLFCNNFTPGAVNKAAEIYTLNVNIQWTNDIAQHVLPVRAQKLNDYSAPQNLDHLTQQVLSAYAPRSFWAPGQIIINQCSNDLRLEFAHVDRWLTIFPIAKRGPQAEAIAPTVKSNYHLAAAFYDQVKNEIYQRIRAHVVFQYCPDVGGRLVGHAIDKHRCCIELLRPFGQETQCWANTATCGKEAREAILAKFKDKGTSFYGGPSFNPPPLATAIPTYDPIEFLCYRPTHVHYFDYYYNILYGDLPRKLLKSRLQMDGAYITLTNKVAAVVAQLNGDYDYTAYGVDAVDWLMVGTADFQSLADVQESANNFGFGPPSAKPGFEFSQGPRNITIDGRTTPLMYFDVIGSMKKPLAKLGKPLDRKDLGVLDPSGPITNPVLETETMTPGVMPAQDAVQRVAPGLKAAPKDVGAGGVAQPMMGSLPEGRAPQAGPGAIQVPVEVKTLSGTGKIAPSEIADGAETQPMSGRLPPSAPVPSMTAQKHVSSPVPPVFPDLTAEAQLTVNGIRTGWGKPLELTSEILPLRVELDFAIKNSGSGDSPGFTVNCVSARKELFQKTVNPLKPAETSRMKAFVDLAVGEHLLVVTVDSASAVTETNEANNRYELRITVSEKPKINLQERITPAPVVKPTVPTRGR